MILSRVSFFQSVVTMLLTNRCYILEKPDKIISKFLILFNSTILIKLYDYTILHKAEAA